MRRRIHMSKEVCDECMDVCPVRRRIHMSKEVCDE
jgi:hypothetical protein